MAIWVTHTLAAGWGKKTGGGDPQVDLPSHSPPMPPYPTPRPLPSKYTHTHAQSHTNKHTLDYGGVGGFRHKSESVRRRQEEVEAGRGCKKKNGGGMATLSKCRNQGQDAGRSLTEN